MAILLTGGLGYIGSNVCLRLEESGISTVIIDNLANSYIKVKDDLSHLTGKSIVFYEGDINDSNLLETIFVENDIDCVMHFAGLKSVSDSLSESMTYYSNNLQGSINLLHAVIKKGIRRFIFSSSATVYGDPISLPITESHPLSANNPYASSKLMFEKCLKDVSESELDFKSISLRYFNPVGADFSGRLSENPREGGKNLAPSIVNVALGKFDQLKVYGVDYDTPDGTAIRDYIHVLDLAEGHLKAYESMSEIQHSTEFNLGTGRGYSVFEMIESFEGISGLKISKKVMPRRDGDVAICYADASQAYEKLGWQANLDLDEMCRSAWVAARSKSQT